MARPKRLNADYFSHDADMRNDPKVRAVRKKFSHTGYSVWCFMLEVISDSSDFELKWDDLTIEIFAGDFDVESSQLREIIDYLVMLDLIQISGEKISCEKLKERLAPMVQKRILAAETYKKISLCGRNDGKTEFLSQKSEEIVVSVTEMTQSKVKESKVKESKKEVKKKDGDTLTPKQVLANENFERFKEWAMKNCQRIMQMKNPLTPDELDQLKSEFHIDVITKMLVMMHNYKPLLSKNISTNLTFRNWIKRDQGRLAVGQVIHGSESKKEELLAKLKSNGN